MSLDSSEYCLKEINELCKINSSSYSKKENWEFINYLDTKNIIKGEINEIKFLDPEIDKVPSRAKRKVNIDDIIISTVRPNQEHYGIIKKEFDNFLVSTGFTTLTVDTSQAVPEFIYYYITQPHITQSLQTIAEQSTTSYPSVKPSDIGNLVVELPSLDIQNKIANMLTSIENKININKEINRNLAKLIDLSFKNYLLNFDKYAEDELASSEFGPIPKGWKVSNLTGIANYQNGLAMQKFPPESSEESFKVLKIKELRQGYFDETSDSCSKNIKEECIVYDGDVIFSWSGSLLVDIWTGGMCGLNQHLFKVTSSNFDKWFYYCWTKFYLDQFILIAKDKATTMGHIKRKHLDESLVLIPDNMAYKKLTNLFKPLFDYLIKNKMEIKNLQKLRDTLLPKLMSGEIDVSEINCDLE